MNNTTASENLDERTKGASVFQAVTLSDTAEVEFLDPEENTTKYCRGFHVNVSGTVLIIPAQHDLGSTPITLILAAGSYYPYAIRQFRATGAVTIASGNIIAMR